MLFLIMIAGCSKETVDTEDSSTLVDDSRRGCETWLWYDDADSDYYGDAKYPYQGCDAPAGYVANDADCDDLDPATYPGAPELCDGLDTNCGGDNMDAGLATFFPEEGEPEPKVFDGSVITLDRSGTLNLCPWRHEGQLLITAQNVTVRGVWGSALTTLDGGAKLEITDREPTLTEVGSVISVKTTNAVAVNAYVTGLTITGGNSNKGGGVYCGGSDEKVTLENVTLTKNVADQGGGLYADWGCHVQVYGVLVDDNRARWSGGGVAIVNATLSIDRLYLSKNSADGDPEGLEGVGGGGLYGDDATITGVSTLTVVENSAAFMGGGIYLSESNVTVPYVAIRRNSASFGGGLFMLDSALLIEDPINLEPVSNKPIRNYSINIVGNTSTNSGGGAILSGNSHIETTSLLLSENEGNPGHGARVDLYASLIWKEGWMYDNIYHGDALWYAWGAGGGQCSGGVCSGLSTP